MIDSKLLKNLSVGRELLISDTVERLKTHSEKKIPIYLLFIGSRGIGKSHLLLSIYYRIIETPEFEGKIFPIKLSEEEYSIANITDFFRRILEIANLKQPKSLSQSVIDETVSEEKTIQQATQRLYEISKSKMPVVFADNLALLFGQFSQRDLKKLRSLLQENNNLSIIGAAPSIFSQVADYGKPFYNFFEIIFLNEWSQLEIEEFIRKKLESEGRDDILKEFAKYKQKITAITILTGGNPRLVITLCDILCAPDKLADIEKTLWTLLDQITPFYQSRMEDLPTQQRKIFDTLSISEGPLTPTEISKLTNYDVNTVNVQLKRLQEIGFVEIIKLRKKREVHYEVKERLFRIWREMRFPLGRRRISLFVSFLKLWYSKDELLREHSDLLQIIKKSIPGNPQEVQTLLSNMWYLQEAVGGSRKYNLMLDRFMALMEKNNFTAAEIEIENLKAIKNPSKMDVEVVFDLEAFLFHAKNEFEKSIIAAQKVLEVSDDDFIALMSMTWSLQGLKRYKDAIKYADLIIASAGGSKAIKTAGLDAKANALHLSKRLDEALSVLDLALEADPKDKKTDDRLLLKGDILFELGKKEEAIICYDKLLEKNESGSHSSEILFRKIIAVISPQNIEEAQKLIDKYSEISPNKTLVKVLECMILLEQEEFEKAYSLAKDCLEHCSMHSDTEIMFNHILLLVTIKQSEKFMANRNISNAKALFAQAINLNGLANSEFFRDWLLKYFLMIMEHGKTDVIDFYNMLDKRFEIEREILIPILRSAEYIATGNVDILEHLQKEIRQAVVSIIKEYSPETKLPKELDNT